MLMTGTTLAQAIPIAVSPILTRIYKPEDFGVFALFSSMSLIFGTIANARYELAIMLPENDEDAFNIAAIGVLISFVLSVLLLLVVFLFNRDIAEILGNEEIGFWLYFLPLSVFFMGLFNVLNYLNSRFGKYKNIARARVHKSLVLSVVQFSIGFFKGGALGLVVGQVLSSAFANLKLLKGAVCEMDNRPVISQKKMKFLAKRYVDFPKFTMWASLANTLSQHFNSILIPAYFSISSLGYYSLVHRVLALPSSLVGGAVGQVYYQRITNKRHKPKDAIEVFDSTVKKLFSIAVPTFGLLFFIVEDLFAFVFGEEWRMAGTYAMVLIPLFAVRFVFSPVSVTCSAFEKQRISLYLQFILFFISLSSIVVSGYLEFSFFDFLLSFSFAVCSYYLFFLYIVRLIAKGRF
ncbi:oligosaccharide flippase family protein [Desulfuromonas acetoxidans]|uniref:lipopolysaccharide biosynthesis protein n=1 Tax=Desulfuromonas acetoxidans TaxID=891 RepID=UPI00292E3870|nr:oligosaccharide flippase family protein [Desulfuromonas acetoxidans]